MRKETDDKPIVDASGKGLGVRIVPINGICDVDLDADGNIVLNGKGMSVAPQWRALPFFLIPKRLRGKCEEARGSDQGHCFVMGSGPFENGLVATRLLLHCDRPNHGNVIPQQLVSSLKFQADIASTRSDWIIDET